MELFVCLNDPNLVEIIPTAHILCKYIHHYNLSKVSKPISGYLDIF
jgi:hypothetical protein